MKRVKESPVSFESEGNLADQMVENDPVFKRRIEASFEEYKATGGITIESLIDNLRERCEK